MFKSSHKALLLENWFSCNGSASKPARAGLAQFGRTSEAFEAEYNNPINAAQLSSLRPCQSLTHSLSGGILIVPLHTLHTSYSTLPHGFAISRLWLAFLLVRWFSLVAWPCNHPYSAEMRGCILPSFPHTRNHASHHFVTRRAIFTLRITRIPRRARFLLQPFPSVWDGFGPCSPLMQVLPLTSYSTSWNMRALGLDWAIAHHATNCNWVWYENTPAWY